MKLTIYYESLVITTEIKSSIYIRDLVTSLARNLKDDSLQSVKALDSEQRPLDFGTKIEANKESSKVYLISVPNLKKKAIYCKKPLDELITEVTGGKTKLKKSKPERTNSNDPMERLAMIEELMNANLSNLVVPGGGGNLNNRIAEVNMIQDMLRNIMRERGAGNQEGGLSTVSIPIRIGVGNNISTGGVVNSGGGVGNNIIPNESHLNNLKEMGFPEDRARRALIMARNNLSRATDLLLSDALDYEQPQK
jgi:hypothetical protein